MPVLPATLDDLRRLQRDAQQLLRGFELDLRQALIAEKDPAGVIQSRKSKLDAFSRQCDDLARPPTPDTARKIIASVQQQTKAQWKEMADRAQRAHDARPNVEKGLVRSYDDAVSNALAGAPSQAAAAGRDQIKKAVRQLVDGALPQSLVRSDQASSFSNAKQQMSDQLSKWLLDQDEVEDAFFVAQSLLLSAAGYLQRQLTIHSQIKDLKTRTEQQKTLDPASERQVDAQAGALGKAWNEGQKQGETAARRAVTVKPQFTLDPRVVLDPSKRFLSEINARVGITIETSSIKIQLSTHVTISEPLMDSRKLSGGEDLRLDRGPWSLTESLAMDGKTTDLNVGLGYTKNNLTFGAGYENKNGVSSVKASITFRF